MEGTRQGTIYVLGYSSVRAIANVRSRVEEWEISDLMAGFEFDGWVGLGKCLTNDLLSEVSNEPNQLQPPADRHSK